ncbi:probable glutathione S-transferase [Eucalyptus grandis]|uniref:probable glutathione S-transferase n=1 Tax=Eucalyptus grandis TaxID=71139 RepID=UPI00192EE4CF|nr:probable glutathione S-transferase [Eucalyptus grandis]
MDGVKLHGFWASPFSSKVIWALKLKGIPFDYIEEDLSNKSALLLQYNPVHKKIPVLVHGSRPVCESMVIIEYLEETWPQYPLLPIDPHERAVVRFWVKFIEEKSPNIWIVYRSVGEEQEKAVRDSVEMLSILEQHGPNRGKKFFGGDGINIVDIAFGGVALWVGAIEEVSGRKLFDAGKFPRLNAWKANFESSPMIAENLPDQEKLRDHLARIKEKRLSSSTCK